MLRAEVTKGGSEAVEVPSEEVAMSAVELDVVVTTDADATAP